ncbi:MAG: vanadium-dependent haloperoxidase [Moorea sp. SIO4A1]|uniref:vanadium-dependent haloperoxidase n=1 Tax=Moorena sp. SIO4A1 TaxID=2607835 RepID=UPI00144B794A|nr:vanadium-dependent haloperoxidase [Moorena sp. SIO4A1]NEQ60005.1 vanadium-dependent haloperoxidase [Moorena sp. SIO4A1]
MANRSEKSFEVRLDAAKLARSRDYPTHKANGDEQRHADDQYFMSFTKGLPHNPDTGLLQDPLDFVKFRRAVDDGFIDPFSDRVRHGAKFEVVFTGQDYTIKPETDPDLLEQFRQWEAPTAGVVFELNGPDPQAVTMPPAPPLIDANGKANPELIFEIAEVYELAILRDQPLNDFEKRGANSKIESSINRLNALDYIRNQTGRPRKVNSKGRLDEQTVFRGSSPGVEVGPYLSQFLLIGNVDLNGGGNVAEGKITYGALQIDQKVPIATPNLDYMTNMEDYVLVQRGIKQDRESYVLENDQNPKLPDRPARRFISTPRDLATYVHYDALYEAYLNACIILLGMQTPFDPGFDHLSGGGVAAGNPATRRNAAGFALYGGPHILTLVTEVATRALKAVRFQKFNNHIRLRPEALAARIELLRRFQELPNEAKASVPRALIKYIRRFERELEGNGTLKSILELANQNGSGSPNYLLPMAFPEGSPMHPAYGAGHATVAGACVTMLKAFFDTSAVLVETPVKNSKPGQPRTQIRFKRYSPKDQGIVFRAPDLSGYTKGEATLVSERTRDFLTLEGELNKLAANISIGRNMAGVHYFTDYYDSLRMGEEIAIGMLEEQALTYSTDPFVLSLPTFDGDVIRIGAR